MRTAIDNLEPNGDPYRAIEWTFSLRNHPPPAQDLPSMAEAWADAFTPIANGVG